MAKISATCVIITAAIIVSGYVYGKRLEVVMAIEVSECNCAVNFNKDNL